MPGDLNLPPPTFEQKIIEFTVIVELQLWTHAIVINRSILLSSTHKMCQKIFIQN